MLLQPVWPKKRPYLKLALVFIFLIAVIVVTGSIAERRDPAARVDRTEEHDDLTKCIAVSGSRSISGELKGVVGLGGRALVVTEDGAMLLYDKDGEPEARFFARNEGVAETDEGFGLIVGETVYYSDPAGNYLSSVPYKGSGVMRKNPLKSVNIGGAEYRIETGRYVQELILTANGGERVLLRHRYAGISVWRVISVAALAALLGFTAAFMIINLKVHMNNLRVMWNIKRN